MGEEPFQYGSLNKSFTQKRQFKKMSHEITHGRHIFSVKKSLSKFLLKMTHDGRLHSAAKCAKGLFPWYFDKLTHDKTSQRTL